MRDFITFWLAGLLMCGGTALASERTDTRTVPAFDKVEASRGITVELVCGAEPTAVVSGSDADVSDTRTTVNGRTLKVERGGSIFMNHHSDVHVRVTAPGPLYSVAVSTGSELTAEPCALSTDHVDLTTSTGATITAAVKTGRLTVEASTGSTIHPLPGQRLDADEVKIHASTGADIRLCRAEHLQGRLTMGANVTIEEGKTSDVSTSMGAEVDRSPCS